MALFKVISIIDSNTIKVEPDWQWGEVSGDTVRVHMYQDVNYIPESPLFKERLKNLLLGKAVELKNPSQILPDKIIYCFVFLNGVEISKYFPEIKVNS